MDPKGGKTGLSMLIWNRTRKKFCDKIQPFCIFVIFSTLVIRTGKWKVYSFSSLFIIITRIFFFYILFYFINEKAAALRVISKIKRRNWRAHTPYVLLKASHFPEEEDEKKGLIFIEVWLFISERKEREKNVIILSGEFYQLSFRLGARFSNKGGKLLVRFQYRKWRCFYPIRVLYFALLCRNQYN